MINLAILITSLLSIVFAGEYTDEIKSYLKQELSSCVTEAYFKSKYSFLEETELSDEEVAMIEACIEEMYEAHGEEVYTFLKSCVKEEVSFIQLSSANNDIQSRMHNFIQVNFISQKPKLKVNFVQIKDSDIDEEIENFKQYCYEILDKCIDEYYIQQESSSFLQIRTGIV